MKRALKVFLALMLLLVLFAPAPWYRWESLPDADNWGPLPFNAEVWRAADGMAGPLGSRGPDHDNRRARMVGDLIGCRLRRGANEAQVRKLLGPEGSGGGSRINGIEEFVGYYPLLAFPSWRQRYVAWKRWGIREPFLLVRLRGKAGATTLVEARVGSEADGRRMQELGTP